MFDPALVLPVHLAQITDVKRILMSRSTAIIINLADVLNQSLLNLPGLVLDGGFVVDMVAIGGRRGDCCRCHRYTLGVELRARKIVDGSRGPKGNFGR